MNLLVTSIFNPFCKLEDIQSEQANFIEKPFLRSGILIWNIIEDRIFLSEGFCRMMGLTKEGVMGLDLYYRLDLESEMRKQLAKLLDNVCRTELNEFTFKSKIQGNEKEIHGSLQLFEMEWEGVLDLMVICWEKY